MKEDFLDSAEQILSFRQHRDSLVKKMVITLIPTLAVYDTQTFSEHYSHKAMGHLLTQLEKPNERSFGKSPSPLRRPILILSSVHCYWAHCHCRRQRDEAILRTRDEPNQAWSPDARVLDHHSPGFHDTDKSPGKRTHHQKSRFSNVLGCWRPQLVQT